MWTATYFNTSSLDGEPLCHATEPDCSLQWDLKSSQAPPKEWLDATTAQQQGFSIRWAAWVSVPESGMYTFKVLSRGPARLVLHPHGAVVNRWSEKRHRAAEATESKKVYLRSEAATLMVLEYACVPHAAVEEGAEVAALLKAPTAAEFVSFADANLSLIPVPSAAASDRATHSNDEGAVGGLLAEYFPQLHFAGEPGKRQVEPVDVLAQEGEELFPGCPQRDFSVRWRGAIMPILSKDNGWGGFFDFYFGGVSSPDVAEFYVNGELVLQGGGTRAPAFLSPNWNPVEVRYQCRSGRADLQLFWASDSNDRSGPVVEPQPVPALCLRSS